ncbi:hypothetical protein D3C73_1361150 [compost metagenome]
MPESGLHHVAQHEHQPAPGRPDDVQVRGGGKGVVDQHDAADVGDQEEHGSTCNFAAQDTVGASLLAMVVNDNARRLAPRGALESIASRSLPQSNAFPCGSELARDGR